MFALEFNFPGGRYHSTPWGQHVNEGDIAWPPEPWRILRALIACYWRKTDLSHWSEIDLARLVEQLSSDSPVYRLPERAIHAHTRHYMPAQSKKTTLIFDAFAHLPQGDPIIVAWPDVVLDRRLMALASDLAEGIGYLGRAESWTECLATTEWDPGSVNCEPVGDSLDTDDSAVHVIAPVSAEEYAAKRTRLIDEADANAISREKLIGRRPPNAAALKRYRQKKFGPTLPERLVDALAIDSSDYRRYGWSRPPASRQVLYRRPKLSPVSTQSNVGEWASSDPSRPQIARFLLAGRPRPRIETAIGVGEVFRLAAMAQFGWGEDPVTGRKSPKAPQSISGRDSLGKPLRDPSHSHAFWIPEDADLDGEIDHLIAFFPNGMEEEVRNALDRLTRLWIPEKNSSTGSSNGGRENLDGRKEWRLALEGFGAPNDFSGASDLVGKAENWISATPFFAAGHLKGGGYQAELRRLMKLRGGRIAEMASAVEIQVRPSIPVGGTLRSAHQFKRSRSRGRERQFDSGGAMLRLTFPEAIEGPLAFGYACHFGLGLFRAVPSANICEGSG